MASLGDLDGDGLTDLAVGAEQDDTGGTNRGAFTCVVPQAAFDYGDAPDLGAGTGTGNYHTLATTMVRSTRSWPACGWEPTSTATAARLQNAAANADDVERCACPTTKTDLVNPGRRPGADGRRTADGERAGHEHDRRALRRSTAGSTTTPTACSTMRTERASVAVPNGTNNGIVTLTFPGGAGWLHRHDLRAVPLEHRRGGGQSDRRGKRRRSGRLPGHDHLAQHGMADNTKTKKIASDTNGGPTLADSDMFGIATASIGDLDGDGVTDLAVGAERDDTGGLDRGAVHVLFMNANGTVKSRQKIASGTGGGPTLADGDRFGARWPRLGIWTAMA